jgi:hypothetical protein
MSTSARTRAHLLLPRGSRGPRRSEQRCGGGNRAAAADRWRGQQNRGGRPDWAGTRAGRQTRASTGLRAPRARPTLSAGSPRRARAAPRDPSPHEITLTTPTERTLTRRTLPLQGHGSDRPHSRYALSRPAPGSTSAPTQNQVLGAWEALPDVANCAHRRRGDRTGRYSGRAPRSRGRCSPR